jgi:hypothetical protein
MRKLAVLLLMAGAAALYGQNGGGTRVVIRELFGTVEVKAPGAQEWTAATVGQELERAGMISTGFKSGAVLAMGDSLLSVRPLTRLTVEELESRSGNERVNISLQTGRLRAEVKAPPGGKTEFTVYTPSASASVRGTVFEFDGTELRVEEGKVHLTGGDTSGTYVGVGHRVTTDPETGRTAGVTETIREELTPSLPAGMQPEAESTTAAPASLGLDAGFDWN